MEKATARNTRRWLVGTAVACLVLGAGGCADKDAGLTTVPSGVSGDVGQIVGLYPGYTTDGNSHRWGYITPNGQFAIAPSYQWCGDFGPDGLAIVQADGKYGVIDAEGKIIEPMTHDDIDAVEPDGTLLARDGNRYRVLNRGDAVAFTSDMPVESFSDGLGAIALSRGSDTRYGFVRVDGTTAITAQYLSVSDFHGGQAVVQVGSRHYAVIDQTGKVAKDIECRWAGHLAEDLLVAWDSPGLFSPEYRYIALKGGSVPGRIYSDAREFIDGFAVAAVDGVYGLIDRTGRFVIPAKYSDLEPIGDGLFAASEPVAEDFPPEFTRKALVDREGRQLTGFLYYDVGPLADGRVSVSDFRSTYFVDARGTKIADLPTVLGYGRLRMAGKVIVAEIDGERAYLSATGEAVWQPSVARSLGDVTVQAVKYRPNPGILIRYPQVTVGSSPEARETINALIKDDFAGEWLTQQVAQAQGGPTTLRDIGFTLDRVGNLLVVHQQGWVTMLNLVQHCVCIDSVANYDVVSGRRYELKDLFRPGTDYESRLLALARGQLDGEQQKSWDQDPPTLLLEYGFTITADALVVHCFLNGTHGYAEEPEEFVIPWTALSDLLNAEGALWQAFH